MRVVAAGRVPASKKIYWVNLERNEWWPEDVKSWAQWSSTSGYFIDHLGGSFKLGFHKLVFKYQNGFSAIQKSGWLFTWVSEAWKEDTETSTPWRPIAELKSG